MVQQHVLWVIRPEEAVPVLSAAFVNVAFQVHTCTFLLLYSLLTHLPNFF